MVAYYRSAILALFFFPKQIGCFRGLVSLNRSDLLGFTRQALQTCPTRQTAKELFGQVLQFHGGARPILVAWLVVYGAGGTWRFPKMGVPANGWFI